MQINNAQALRFVDADVRKIDRQQTTLLTLAVVLYIVEKNSLNSIQKFAKYWATPVQSENNDYKYLL